MSLRVWAVLCCCLLAAGIALGQSSDSLSSSQMPSVVDVPPGAQPSANFNVEIATEAYLAQIPPAARARSDAYFEGGYWLILWDFLYGVAVLLLVLNRGWSAAMRNFAQRVTRFKLVHTAVYWVQYIVLTTLLTFSLAYYEGYAREHKYGMATQTFGPWLNGQFKNLLLGVVLGAIAIPILFVIVRRLPNTWWIWGAIAAIFLNAVAAMIAPVFIFPIFN
jgi:STE24 endopeptidase